MSLKNWVKTNFSYLMPKPKKEILAFDELYKYLSGSGGWLQSEIMSYSNPRTFTGHFRRRVRIYYNLKWHRGKFKPWKDFDKKDFDKFFIVETKSGRKMLVPKENVYFKQKYKKRPEVPHNWYFETYTILIYIVGDIKIYEKLYKDFNAKRSRR